MKNSQSKYLIAIVLIGVWSTLAYRFYQKYQPAETALQPLAVNLPAVSPTIFESYTLDLSYPDPFRLHKTKIAVQNNRASKGVKKNKSRISKIANKPQARKAFPKLTYRGMVKVDNDMEVAIINFQGEMVHWKKGSLFNEMKLNEISSEEIVVGFQEDEKSFPIYLNK